MDFRGFSPQLAHFQTGKVEERGLVEENYSSYGNKEGESEGRSLENK